MGLGSVTAAGGVDVSVTGVNATGVAGTVFIWGVVDTAQTPNWAVVSSA